MRDHSPRKIVVPDTPPKLPWFKKPWSSKKPFPVDLKRLGEWISVGRDMAALLFIPFLCFYGGALVLILWKGYGTTEHPEAVVLAVVNYLGAALIGLVALIGLGVLWLQRRNIPSLSVTTPWGTATIGSGDAGQASLAAAAIDAITSPEAPSVAAAAAGQVAPPSKPVASAIADAEAAAASAATPDLPKKGKT